MRASLAQMARVEGDLEECKFWPDFEQFPQDLIQTNVKSQLGMDWSTTTRNWAVAGLLVYEQSIEIGAFFLGNF